MKHLPNIIIAFLILAVFSCTKQRPISNAASDNVTFDFSQFYRVNETDEYIYDAHRNVPLGRLVALKDLDSIFGKPIMCDTVTQTLEDWSLFEQEGQVANFLPSEKGDTLVMMRRIYGKN